MGSPEELQSYEDDDAYINEEYQDVLDSYSEEVYDDATGDSVEVLKEAVYDSEEYPGDLDLETAGLGKDVVELTDDNFGEKVLKEKETGWLVDFYAPWCGHSKRLQQPWAEAATRLKGKMNLGAFDADQHESTADKFGIEVRNYSMSSCVFHNNSIIFI